MDADTNMTAEGGETRTKAVDQLREQTRAVREDVRELGRIGRDAAQEKLEEARRAAGELVDQGRRRAGDLEDQLVDYVRERPMKSMLIAAGVGALLGMIWTRR